MGDNFNGERPGNETNVQTGGPSAPVTKQDNTLGVIGLVTGIIGLIFAICCYPIGILFGIIALICGLIAKGKNQKFAMAGIFLGVSSIVLAIIMIVVGRAGLAFLEGYDWESWLEGQMQ